MDPYALTHRRNTTCLHQSAALISGYNLQFKSTHLKSFYFLVVFLPNETVTTSEAGGTASSARSPREMAYLLLVPGLSATSTNLAYFLIAHAGFTPLQCSQLAQLLSTSGTPAASFLSIL